MSDQEQRTPSANGDDSRGAESHAGYWRKNVMIMTLLLSVWAVAGLGCGVLFSDFLNQFEVGGFPLGFWFAQQGSIVVFVILILAYAVLLQRLDRRHAQESTDVESGRNRDGA